MNPTHKKTKSGSKGQNDKREMCKISNGNGRNVPKAKGKRQRGKNNIKKVRKRLLKHTDIAKERVLPQKDSE